MSKAGFVHQALAYLVQLFPEMAQRVTTSEQIALWYKHFGHLDIVAWRKAVETYYTEKHYPPTIGGLTDYLLPSQQVRIRKPRDPDDPSRYDVRTYAEFARDEPLLATERVPAREVKELLSGLYEKFNENEGV